jgi:hypothetical protein
LKLDRGTYPWLVSSSCTAFVSGLLAESAMSAIAADSPAPSAFPLELELHILELAALTSPISIPKFMLVAWHIKTL